MRTQLCLFATVMLMASGCHGDARSALSVQDEKAPDAGGEKRLSSNELYRMRNLGRMHASRGTAEGFEESYKAFQKVVEMSPKDLRDRLNICRALVFSSLDPTPALEHLAAARKLAPRDGNAALEYLLGLTYKRLGQPAEAARAFAATTKLRGDIANVWFQRGNVEEQSDQVEAAQKSFERAVALETDHRGSLFRLANIAYRAGEEDKGDALMDRFEQLPEVDHEKCELTEVTLRGIPRTLVEPPEAKFSWADVTDQWLTEPVSASEFRKADVNGDGRPDLVVMDQQQSGCVENSTDGMKPQWPAKIGEKHSYRDVAVADLDNDGVVDGLFCGTGLLQVQFGMVRFGESPKNQTTFDETTRHRVQLVDIDHDGDLDAVHSTGELIRNNGDRTFESAGLASFPGVETLTNPDSFAAHDLDQANDVDFVFAGEKGARAYLNLRDGTFKVVELPQLAGMTRVLVEDLDGDGAPDIFAASDSEYRVLMNSDPRGVRHEARFQAPVTAGFGGAQQVHDVELADLDNDADLDVVLATDAGVIVLRNRAGGTFMEMKPVPVAGGGVERVTAVDLDGDCLLEVAVLASGKLRILSSNPEPRYEGWTVKPEGKKDNKDAIGTVVEQFAGPVYQSRMVRETGGLHFGLGSGGLARMDGLRLRWPQGIIQPVPREEFELTGCTTTFPQKEALTVSCPYLYVRNADGWHYVTDVVGIAPLGEWVPPGREGHLDPEEFVRIPGDLLTAIDGTLYLAVTEELKEATYLDRVELVAVDHPRGTVVYTSESTRQGAYDPLALFVCAESDLRAPAAVRARVEDAGTLAAETDGAYLHPYERGPSQWLGWVEPHAFEFELAAPATHLFLTGRTAWYDSTVAYALHQNGRTWSPLRLEHAQSDGARVLLDDIGLPAGMDRTVVNGFARTPLPAGTRLRIAGQYQVFWDRIRLAQNVHEVVIEDGQQRAAAGDLELRIHRRPVRRATLGYHGYSRAHGDERLHEQTYDYQDTSPKEPWYRPSGHATRYGDVTELLTAHDDLSAVFVSGDRVELEMDAPPAPARGQTRTWFLRVTGWAKETGFHVNTGNTLEPLPVRGMQRYPPAETERRTDAEYRAYLEEYQTREIVR